MSHSHSFTVHKLYYPSHSETLLIGLEKERAGRYASGTTVPAAARAFAAFQRGDYATVIDRIVPMLAERERIGGSRAQVDLIEFTLLASYLRSGRQEDARRLRAQRRPGGSLVPVAGLN